MIVKTIVLSMLLSGAMVSNAAVASCSSTKSELRIQKAVTKAFDNHEYLDRHVNFRVDRDTVILTGKVDNVAQKNQARQVVANVSEVGRVDNQIEVK